MNKAIEKCQNRVTPVQKDIIENSWNYKKLSRVLIKHYNRGRVIVFKTLGALEKGDSYSLYMKWRPILKKAAFKAIRNRPKVYIKYVYSNLMVYFFHHMGDPVFYRKLQKRYFNALRYKKRRVKFLQDREKIESRGSGFRVYYKKEYVMSLTKDFPKAFLKEYWEPGVLSKVKTKKTNKGKRLLEPTFLQRVHQVFKSVHEFLFLNNLWIYIFLFTFIYSFFILLKSRFHHKEALILFIMTLSAFLHGVVVSMSALAGKRLSYPMNFVYYLSLFLLPTIINFDASWWLKIKKVINSGFAVIKRKRE
jgi:hypothetical protein